MAYPTSIATDSDLYLTKNQLSGVLNGSLDASQTTVTMASTTGFPAVGVVTVDSEVIKYTSTNSTQLLGCTRGFDGTSATTHSSGATVKHAVTAIHHNALKDELIAVETNNMPGQIVGTTTNDSASAGKIGEYILSSNPSNVNFPSTLTYGDHSSIVLTAGDWEINAMLRCNSANSTGTTTYEIGVTSFSGNSNSGFVQGLNACEISFPADAVNNRRQLTISGYRLSLASTTTVYLKMYAAYTNGQPVVGGGSIHARRVR